MKQKIRNTDYQTTLFVFHWAVLLNVCLGNYVQQDSTIQAIEIRIDPAAVVGGVDATLFDSITYIPLETNKHSEFSTITQLEVTKNHYIILDRTLNTLFFFNRDGSFSHKIDKNNENAPFGSLREFALDRSKNILAFRDTRTPYTYTFGLDGDLQEVVERKMSFRNFALFNGFEVCYHPLYFNNRNDGTHFDNIIRYDARTDEHLGSYLPVDSARKNVHLLSSSSSKNFYQSDAGYLLFTQPYDYTIYEFDSIAVPHKRYTVILPLANTVPADFLSNPTYHGKWRDYLSSNRALIYSIRDVYVSGDWLTFYTSPSIRGSAFLYNLATYELFNLKETKDSILGLPVTEYGQPVIGVDKGALISELPFVNLKKLYEETPGPQRNDVFPQHLRALMNKESHNSILRLSYLKQYY